MSENDDNIDTELSTLNKLLELSTSQSETVKGTLM